MSVPVTRVDGALVDALANWLMDRAIGESSPQELLAGCCEQLLVAGVPVARGYLAFRTLHPLFRAVTLTWRPGHLEVQQLAHGELPEAVLTGPHQHMATRGIGRLRRRIEPGDAPLEFAVLEELRAAGATDYFAWTVSFGGADAAGLGARDGLIGSWTCDRPDGFSDAHLQVLRRIERRLAVACKVCIKEQIARNILRAYLGPAAGERVYAGGISRGSGDNIHAVIWFADLRDSTRLSDQMPIAEFLALLNGFFECIADPVLERGGEVLRFIGDAVLAVFPMADCDLLDPVKCPVHRAACELAIAAARDALARVAAFNAQRAARGHAPIAFGIGLHVGDVMYGNIGVPSRVEFSVVGSAANHAARIETLCKALGVPLLVSRQFASILPDDWVSLGRHALPGIEREQEVLTLAALAPPASARTGETVAAPRRR